MIITLNIILFTFLVTFINLLTGFKRKSIFGCGLVGFSGQGKFSLPIIKVLLWHNSQTRGKDATGIFTPKSGIIKDVVEAKEFFKNEELNKIVEFESPVLAHVRKATVGNAKDPDSAHPWDFGNIVMMHNGTLDNYKELASQYNIEKYTVDSQVLGQAISKNFTDGKPFAVLNEYSGAAAVIVYHKERDSIFVYRDEDRTLFYGYVNDTEMYISSLEDILLGIGCKNVTSFEPFKVHEIKNGNIISKFTIKRKKANQNSVFRNIITKLSDIISFKYYNTIKFRLTSDYYSGFKRDMLDPKYLDGYWVRSKYDIKPAANAHELAQLTADKFYKIVRVISDKIVAATDDTGKQKHIYLDTLDYENFIPTVSDYVICQEVPTTNNGLKVGEMYEVLHHTFGLSDVVVRNHETNMNVGATIANFRLATISEINNYFKKDVSKSSSCQVIQLGPAKHVADDCDYTEVIEEPVQEASILDDVEEEVDKYELVFSKYIESLNLTNKAVRSIMKNVEDKKYEEALAELRVVNIFTEKCNDLDSEYILNVNENSLLNIDYAK